MLLPTDEFIIIACDGLWDVISTDLALTDCRRALRQSNDCQKAAEFLVESALKKHTTDNVSVIVIGFGNFSENGNLQIVTPFDKSQSRLLGRCRGIGSCVSLKNKTKNNEKNVKNHDDNIGCDINGAITMKQSRSQ